MAIKEVSTDMMFANYMSQHLNAPFKWGHNDCICFVVGWVELVTGKDYLSEYSWANEREALQLIKELGGIEAMFDKHLRRVPPNFAKDGDITYLDGTAYLFCGSRIASVGKNGLLFKNRMEAKCAWSF
jgi:hypothetical protein